MAEPEQEQAAQHVEQENDDDNPNYKTPAPKGLSEIVNADAEDESLRKYKEALLGKSTVEEVVIDPNKGVVIVEKLTLLCDDRDPMFLDLTKTPEELKKCSFTLKEGCHYLFKIDFYVQKDIVTGLKYTHKVFRKGVKVDSMQEMIGSFGPKREMNTYTSPKEEAPAGMLMRGDYKIKSRFVDDDNKEYACWEWNLSIKKDW